MGRRATEADRRFLRSVTSKYIHVLDTDFVMAADTVTGHVEDPLDGKTFEQSAPGPYDATRAEPDPKP
jgi:hypothetical protein